MAHWMRRISQHPVHRVVNTPISMQRSNAEGMILGRDDFLQPVLGVISTALLCICDDGAAP